MATMIRRTNGYYYIVSTINGKRRWISTRTRNRSEALKKIGQVESGHTPAATAPRLIEFYSEMLQHLEGNYAPGTIEVHKRSVASFTECHGNVRLDGVGQREIDVFIGRRLSRVQASTVNVELHCLKAIWYRALRWGYIDKNPFIGIQKVPVPEKHPKCLEPRDIARLIVQIREPWFRHAVILAVNTGMRCGEICNLRFENVNLGARTLRVENSIFFRTKTRKQRVIPLNDAALEVIRKRCASASSDDLVFTYRGRAITRKDLHRFLKKYLVELDLDRTFSFHGFRHTYATMLITRSVSLFEVQKLLGHSSPRVTEIYSHLIPETRHATVALVSDAIEEGMKSIESCSSSRPM